MALIIRSLAKTQIRRVTQWVETKNTQGAGERWLIKLEELLSNKAKTTVKHAICQSKSVSRHGYMCFTYNDKWIVAYRIEDKDFIVCRFVWGAKLR